MRAYKFSKSEKSWIRMECDRLFYERWFAMADTAVEFRSKTCLGDYVRGAALTLASDVAIHFAEKYSNDTLNDVCDLLREQGFFKSKEGLSEKQAEEQFRSTILG